MFNLAKNISKIAKTYNNQLMKWVGVNHKYSTDYSQM